MHRGQPYEEGELRVVGREIDAACLFLEGNKCYLNNTYFLPNKSVRVLARRLHQGPLPIC